MGSNWKICELDKVIKKRNQGVNTTTEKVKYSSEGIIVIRANNILSGRIDYRDCAFVDEETFSRIKDTCKPRKGDVLYTNIGSQFGTAVKVNVDFEFAIAWNVLRIQTSNEVDSDFLVYLLNNPVNKRYIQSLNSSSTMPFVSGKVVGGVAFKFPSIAEQIKIKNVLKPFEHSIELNRQTNQTLEQIAQALFKSWFVDFDPVFDNLLASADFKLENLETSLPDELKQKAQRRLVALDSLENVAQYKASLSALAHELQAQLPTKEAPQATVSAAETPVKANFNANPNILAQHANTHAHFPNEFEHNEQLGWIPKGWDVGVSGDLVDVRDGTHDSPKKSEKGFPLVTSRHITSGRLDLSAAYLISELDYKKVNERSNVEYGDILLTMIGTVGVPYLVMDEPANYAIKNIGLFRTSKNLYLKNYLHILLKSDHMQAYLNARVAGTTQKYLSLKVLRNIDFLLPSNIVLEKFNSIVNNMLFKEKSNIDQINQLTKLRDTLLPKLISGELQIPDVATDEKIVD